MAGVTIQGGASLAQGIQTIHMGSAVNAQIAQSLLDSANAGILDGTVKTYRPSYWSGNTAQFLNVPTLNNVLFIPNVINAGTVAVPSTQTSVVFDYATVADTVSPFHAMGCPAASTSSSPAPATTRATPKPATTPSTPVAATTRSPSEPATTTSRLKGQTPSLPVPARTRWTFHPARPRLFRPAMEI